MEVKWSDKALKDYKYFQKYDPKNAKDIDELLDIIELYKGEPLKGKGRPEELKYGLTGLMSRRIGSTKHRLIYKTIENTIYIYSCRGHYK